MKNLYPPHGRSWEIPRGRGRGVLKAKILEARYEAKLEFHGGRGQNKTPSMGGVWIFSGAAGLSALCIGYLGSLFEKKL